MPSEYKPPEYKPPKKCLRTSISPGLIFGILRYIYIDLPIVLIHFKSVDIHIFPNQKCKKMKKVALVMLSLKFTKSNPSSTKCNKRPCTSPAHQRRPTSTSKLGPWYFHERDLKWRWSYSY